MRTLRRHWLQFAALAVVVAVLVVLWVVGGRSGSSASGGGPAGASVSRTAVPSPPEDPRAEQVRAAAMSYFRAIDASLKSGSPNELDALTVAGSQARGLAGNPSSIVHGTHKTFVVIGRDFQTLDVQVFQSTATATLSFDDHGYNATWPSLQRAGADHVLHHDERLTFQLVAGKWLVNTEQ